MSTGPLNEQEFAQNIRAIGHRKRSGSLDVIFSGKHLIFYFLNGKLVEASEHNVTPATTTYRYLLERKGLEGDSEVTFSTYQELMQESGVSSEVLLHGLQEKIIDYYLSIPMNQGGMFSLHSGVPDTDRDFSVSISTGQMLLDYVAIKEEEQSLKERSRGKPLFFLATGADSELNGREYGINKISYTSFLKIVAAPVSFEEIQRELFTSRLGAYLHIKYALDHGIIAFTDPVSEKKVIASSDQEDIDKKPTGRFFKILRLLEPPPIGDEDLMPDVLVLKGRYALVAGYSIAIIFAWLRYLL